MGCEMDQAGERGTFSQCHTTIMAFIQFAVAIAMINCAQGSDAGLILWSSGAIVFVATAAAGLWLPRKADRSTMNDARMLAWFGKLLLFGCSVAVAIAEFSRGDSLTLVIMVLGATVLVGLGAGLSRRSTRTLAYSLCMLAALSFAISNWLPLTINLFLLSAVFIGLTVAAFELGHPSRRRNTLYSGKSEEPMLVSLTQWLDVLIVPFFLSEKEVLIYLTVRCTVGAVSGAIEAVQQVILPRLVSAYANLDTREFRGLVARASLGVLLIGGAVVLVALMAAPSMFPRQVIDVDDLDAFYILVLAVMVPVVLGVFPALMKALVPMRQLMSAYLASIFVVAVLAAILRPGTAVEMAQIVAIGQSVCALWLARINFCQLDLLPAITALLHPKIRLWS
ncbi:hypothetical protein DSM107133_03560 [Pseudosulfitobacter sp. DSM 107133]|nr:hypothetical protein DSM107133_03560 [Pseudosulfitobacter sp. DSM 107133]